jgi:hypothetical protein
LFETNIVANRSLGRLSNFEAMFDLVELLSFICIRSCGLNEKYATSAPEINAEKMSRAIVIIKANAEAKLNDK